MQILEPPDGGWFAAVTKHHHELTVAAAFAWRGLKQYVPLYRCRRAWSDRVKTIEAPLFSNYVFCQFGGSQYLQVLQTPGVLSVVSFGQKLAVIPDAEISAIRTALECGVEAQPWPYLRTGDAVRVSSGALSGIEGIVIRDHDKARLVISVNLLQRSVAVEIDRASLQPLATNQPHYPINRSFLHTR
jgi:transcription antitermination factor NusG